MTTKLHEPDLSGATDILAGSDWVGIVPMWVPAFFGDSNRSLKEIQLSTYASLVYELFRTARSRYLDACDLLGVETEISTQLESLVTPAMPCLGRVYRKVAAFYRYALDPGTPRARDAGTAADRIRADWEAFFRNESAWMTGRDDTTRDILEAVVLPDQAVEAEERLVSELRRRYGALTLRRRAELRRHPLRRHGGTWPAAPVEPDATERVRPNPPD